MFGKVEAFEMTPTTANNDSPRSIEEKDFDRHTNVAEVESTSDIQPHTNRSSEDLVNPSNSNNSVNRVAATSESRSTMRILDLEIGAATSPQKMEVRVNQFYNSSSRSHTADRPVSPPGPEWEHESPWNVGWPRKGFGNKVVCQARDGGERK